jgi:hypothetical protein
MNHCKWLSWPCSFMLALALLCSSSGAALAFVSSQSKCGHWSVVPSPSPGPSVNNLYSVSAAAANDVWAVGDADTPGGGGGFNTLIEHWNGSQWSVVSSPDAPGSYASILYSVSATSSTDAWAAGYYTLPGGGAYTLIEHWDGSQWSVIPSPNPGSDINYLYGISVASRTDVWAVGYYTSPSGDGYTLIEYWNGSQWSVISSPNPSQSSNILYGVSATSSSNAWVTGYYSPSDGGTYTLIEHWNGSQWNLISSPSPGLNVNYLYGISAVSSVHVWAAGDYFSSSQSHTHTLIEQWNGLRWRKVNSPSPGGFANLLYASSALSATDAWVVGEYLTRSQTEYTLTEHWNGSSWKVIPAASPGPAHTLKGVTQAPGTTQVWAVGIYSNGSHNQTLIEFYC